MNTPLNVVKIGGAIIDEPDLLDQFLMQFAALEGSKILVHGGGRSATEMSKALGIEPKMVDGRRITDAATLKVACMMYAGVINKQIVASLQAKGVNALGLSGADGNVLPAVKRPINEIDYGWVGDIHTAELSELPLKNLINADFIPVFCALTHDGNGHMLNTNADTIAMAVAVLASRFTETRLCFAFEKNGVLKDVNDDNSVIPSLQIHEAEKLILSGKIHSGMRPKISAANEALNKGCHQVIIANASNLSAVIAGDTKVPFTEFKKA